MLKGSLWAVLLFFVMGAGVAGGVVAAYVRDLPPLDILEEYQPSLVTTLYDDQGKPFASFYEQRRILVPLDKIPRFLHEATVADVTRNARPAWASDHPRAARSSKIAIRSVAG